MIVNNSGTLGVDGTGAKERKKIHPQKFMMWLAMASMSMAFAGLTSGYMVREAQDNWRYYKLPAAFWFSLLPIVLSSITIMMGVKAFKNREMPKFRMLITVTLVLGLLFAALQVGGFYQLYHQLQHIRINGQVLNEMATVRVNGNPSESFLFIIAGLHLAHLLGGIVALTIVFFRAFRTSKKTYSATGLEITATYWHFVDILWLYLFVFFLVNQ